MVVRVQGLQPPGDQQLQLMRQGLTIHVSNARNTTLLALVVIGAVTAAVAAAAVSTREVVAKGHADACQQLDAALHTYGMHAWRMPCCGAGWHEAACCFVHSADECLGGALEGGGAGVMLFCVHLWS